MREAAYQVLFISLAQPRYRLGQLGRHTQQDTRQGSAEAGLSAGTIS